MVEGSDQADLARWLGREGERVAADFLKCLGFRILERNYRCRMGEVDLIVQKGDRILFVEVKSRRSQETVSALESIPRSKQLHLSRVAQYFIATRRRGRGLGRLNGEFALAIVDFAGPEPRCEILEGIFPLAWGY